VLSAALAPYALRDLQRGLDARRFDVPDVAVTLNDTGGALLGVMRAVLDGQLGDDAAERHAENVLRILGLPRDEAAAIARRPLPRRLDLEPAGQEVDRRLEVAVGLGEAVAVQREVGAVAHAIGGAAETHDRGDAGELVDVAGIEGVPGERRAVGMVAAVREHLAGA